MPTFKKRQIGGGCMSDMISILLPMSEATTSLLPSISSDCVQISMDNDSNSGHEGTSISVKQIGKPKSSTTNLFAPLCIRSIMITCCGGGTNNCCQDKLLSENCNHERARIIAKLSLLYPRARYDMHLLRNELRNR